MCSNYAEKAMQLNPIDDIFFQKMSEDRGFCEEILRVILHDDKLIVKENMPQKLIRNLQGRSVILDALCLMSDGQNCLVEVQKANDDNHFKRVRYNESCLTTNITDPGLKFEDVPNVCTVYITKSDIFKRNRVIYHVNHVVLETGDLVENGSRQIYVNTKVKDGSDISELMTLFTDSNAYSEKFPATSKRKRYFKETEKGRESMNDTMQRLFGKEIQEAAQQAAQEAAQETAQKAARETAQKAFENNLSMDMVQKLVDLPLEDLQEIYDEVMAVAK